MVHHNITKHVQKRNYTDNIQKLYDSLNHYLFTETIQDMGIFSLLVKSDVARGQQEQRDQWEESESKVTFEK